MSTLFGILRTDAGDREIRRIDTNSEMAKFAESEFDKQYSDFFFFEQERRKKTKFEPTWPKANPNEVLFIEDFDDTIGFSTLLKTQPQWINFFHLKRCQCFEAFSQP